MNLEQAIRERWLAAPALTTLAPLSRLWTGEAPPDVEMPFVVLTRGHTDARTRTSSGRLIAVADLRLAIVAGDLQAAQTIQREIERQFDGVEFAFDEGRVIDMRCSRSEPTRSRDGVWRIDADYRATIDYIPQGD
jgi:hypothetical protein